MKTVKKTVKYKKDILLLDYIQLVIGIILVVSYLIALIPTFYFKVSDLIFTLLIVQILISLIRLNILNFILELFVLGISVISLIPALGYFFRFIGFFGILLDTLTYKSYRLKKFVTVETFRTKNKTKTPKKRRLNNKDNKVYDAEYKEK